MLRCERILGNDNYWIGRVSTMQNQMMPMSKALASKSQRALLMCKPDALARGLGGQIITDVSLKLKNKGIWHRIVAPKIFQMAHPLAQIFYDNVRKDHGEKVFDVVTRYASGTHPDPRVPQAPVIAFIVEASLKEGDDLTKILRSDDMIGPTSIKEEDLNADPARAEQIRKSLRYKYTLGMGVSQKPFEGSPGMNCIHCSSSAEDAKREISTIYGKKELSPYYSSDALALVYEELNGEAKTIRDKAVSMSFQKITEMPEPRYMEYVSRFSPYFKYRDFDKQRLFHVHKVAKEIYKLSFETGMAYLRRLISASGIVNELLTSPVRPKKIIGISGYSGSGKSMIIDNLVKDKEYKKMMLVTTRPARKDEINGKDYVFVSDKEFEEMLYKNIFAAIEEGNGFVYGIRRDDLTDALINENNLVFAGGKNMVRDVKYYLHSIGALNKTHRFSSVFIKIPGESAQELANTITSRIHDRSDAEERSINPFFDYKNPTQPFSDDYDLILVNEEGQFERTMERIRSHIDALDRAPATGYAKDMERITHWNKIETGLSLIATLKQLKTMSPSTKQNELSDIMNALEESRPQISRLFACIKNASPFVPEINKGTLNENDKRTIDHTIAALASLFQIESDYLTVARSEHKIGRLSISGMERFIKNFDEIRALYDSLSINDKLFIVLLHDIGKLVDTARHPNYSYQMIESLSLHRWFRGMSPQDITLNKMAVLYHIALGSLLLGDHSFAIVYDMFSNPILKSSMSHPDGKVDLQAVEKFLNRLLLLTFVDVAGTGDEKGSLNNSRAEIYLDMTENIYETFKINRDSYETAMRVLDSNAPKYNKFRIAMFIGIDDALMEQRDNPMEAYKQIIASKVKEAVKNGDFSLEEWDEAVNNLHRIKTIQYGILSYLSRIPSGKNEIKKGLNENMGVSFFKFIVILSKIIKEFVPTNQFVELRCSTLKNEPIISKKKRGEAAIELNKLLNNASVATTVRNGTIFIVDKIDRSKIVGGLEIYVHNKRSQISGNLMSAINLIFKHLE